MSLLWRRLMHDAVIDGNGNRAYKRLPHVLPFPAQRGKPSWETTILNVWPSSIRDRSRKLQKIEMNRACLPVQSWSDLRFLLTQGNRGQYLNDIRWRGGRKSRDPQGDSNQGQQYVNNVVQMGTASLMQKLTGSKE